jgi:glutathione S-transferase
MQGQSTFFLRSAPEKIPYALKRYSDETKRLYGVLQIRLGDGNRDYLAGPGRGKYSQADINAWGWVRIHPWAGIPDLDEFPAVKAWVDRIAERPAGKTGPTIPVDLDLINKAKQQAS